MICPACKNPLREKNAGGMTVDVCYGGCGGIWFDAKELERVSARATTTLHNVWNTRATKPVESGPRPCPRCDGQMLQPKWFSERKKVEIDECPQCRGVWLDAGEFSRIYEEFNGARETSPLWKAALEVIAAFEKPTGSPSNV